MFRISAPPPGRGGRVVLAGAAVLTMGVAAVSCSGSGSRAVPTGDGSDIVMVTPSASEAPGGRSATPSRAAGTPPAPGPAAGSVLAGLPAGAPATAAGVARTLAAAVTARGLGPAWGLVVLDPRTGKVLAARTATAGFVPASTTKLLTATAVLARYGPAHRFTTRVEVTGTSGGVTHLSLVGGGDPSLTAADGGDPLSGDAADDPVADPARLSTLVSATAAGLRATGTTTVSVSVDDSLFAAPATSPEWESGYVSGGFVGPVDALSLDGGRTSPSTTARTADPALAAGAAFAEALRDAGVAVDATVRRAAPPPAAATVLAAVSSPPLVVLLRHMLLASDDDYAEDLARQVAAGTGTPASFTGSSAAVLHRLAGLGLDTTGTRLHDGSGLSRDDSIPPLVLARVLALTLRSPELAGVPRGLPVAGRSGTLAYRFTGAARFADGQVFAKTGTLTGVDGLAGYVRTASAGPLVVVVLADRTASAALAQPALDLLVARLVRCGCHG